MRKPPLDYEVPLANIIFRKRPTNKPIFKEINLSRLKCL
jgi:hypothetical protein